MIQWWPAFPTGFSSLDAVKLLRTSSLTMGSKRASAWLLLLSTLVCCGGRASADRSQKGCSDVAHAPCLGGMAGRENGGAGVAGAGVAGATTVNLKGYYDIRFGASPPEQPVACASGWPSTSGRLLFGTASPCSVSNCTSNALELAKLWSPSLRARRVSYEPGRVVLSDFEYLDDSDRVSQLTLLTIGDEFAGTGTATIRKLCKDGSSLSFDVTVTLARDTTPARVFPKPLPVFAPYAVSWGELRLDGSESLVLDEFPDGLDLASFVGLQGVTPESQRPSVSIMMSAWDGLHIDHPEEVAGTTQRLYLKQPLYDTAGNPVEAGLESIQFAEDEVISSVLDYDTTAPRGVVGVSTYYPPGAQNSPCELGGCLVLGPVAPCTALSPTFYSFRLLPNHASKLRIRMGLQSTAELYHYLARWVGPGMYIQHSLSWGTEGFLPVSPAVGNMSYATPFFDWELPIIDAGRGGAIAFVCEELPETERGASIQVILERIEFVPAEG